MAGPRMCLALGAVAVLWAATGFAQPIDCATLPALCPVNPLYDDCVLPALEVASPCVVDFGDQRVVIRGTLRVPAGGVVSFKSYRIEVAAPIRAGDGAQVSFEGTNNLRVVKPISIPGGSLTLRGYGLGLWGAIKAKTRPGGPPASVTIEATDAAVYIFRPIRLNGRRGAADGGNLVVHAVGEVQINNKLDVSGLHAGGMEIESSGDEVSCHGCRLQARGGAGGPGSIRVTAPRVSFYDVFGYVSKVLADGKAGGGDVRLKATGSQLGFWGGGVIDARGGGGIIEASAPQSVRLSGTFLAAPGGCIGLSAPTLDTADATFDVTPVSDCPGSASGAFVD